MFSSEDIKNYREKHGCSMQEAITHFTKRDLIKDVANAESLTELKLAILKLIDKVFR